MAKAISFVQVDDLARFYRIAEILQTKECSLREVSRELKCSTTQINDCLNRLNEKYKSILIATRARSSGGTQLTVEGLRLLERYNELLRTGGGDPSRCITIHFAHSLLTSQLISPALADFVRSVGDDVRNRLVSRTEMDFNVVVRDILAGTMDLAITWGLPSRTETVTKGVEIEEIGPPLELALISHSRKLLESIARGEYQKQAIENNFRFVALSKDRQPFPKEKKYAWLRSLSRLEADTFDAVVAFVRAKVGDLAIVPAACSDLERSRSLGQLDYFKLPTDTIRVAIFSKPGGRRILPPHVRKLLGHIETRLKSLSTEAPNCADNPSPQRSAFPISPEWYEKFRYGYYLDVDRTSGGGGGTSGSIEWRWEEVTLKRRIDDDVKHGSPVTFCGQIKNSYGAEFNIQRGELLGEVFYVAARKKNKVTKSVESFVSVFSTCYESKGIMFGLWSGLNPAKQAALYSTVWSHKKLSQADVSSIVNCSAVSLDIDSLLADHFDEQP